MQRIFDWPVSGIVCALFCALAVSQLDNAPVVVAAPIVPHSQGDSLPLTPLSNEEKVVSLLRNLPGVHQSLRVAIRDPQNWAQFWDQATEHGVIGGMRSAPTVDFSREILVIASNGVMHNYETIDITKVESIGDTLVAFVRTRLNVFPACAYFMLDTPVAMVRVPRDQRPVKFIEQRIDEKCAKKP